MAALAKSPDRGAFEERRAELKALSEKLKEEQDELTRITDRMQEVLAELYFLNKLSKAARASAGVRGALAAGPLLVVVASRATVTRDSNSSHSFCVSLGAMRIGTGFKHWNRVDGSKCAHCLQQCRAELHFGQAPRKSTPLGNVVEQFQQRAAVTV